MNEDNKLFPYANAIISLLQGILYNEDNEWRELLSYKSEVEDHFNGIGLEVFIDEPEGFAFLKQKDFSDETFSPIKLVKKIQLSYPITLLCILLREKLLEFDASSSESGRLILSRDDIKELIQNYLPDESNEAKISERIDTNINKLIEYGFLHAMNQKKDKLEVKRILRAVIDADKLNEIKDRLIEYARNI